jgi:4'-phosphopantetheinyl transferase
MTNSHSLWQHPIGRYALPADRTHVWRADLRRLYGDVPDLRNLLSVDECGRADRYQFEADRNRYIVARAVLRLLLGHCLDCAVGHLTFATDRFGKPTLLAPAMASLQFNVSHSGDYILVALNRRHAVGVDVERIRADLAMEEIAQRFFSLREWGDLSALTSQERPGGFFACWTRKEAYLKGRGDGLTVPLAAFDVTLRPGDDVRLIETRHDINDVHRWTLSALDCGNDYRAAVAVAGRDAALDCWEWPTATGSGEAAMSWLVATD